MKQILYFSDSDNNAGCESLECIHKTKFSNLQVDFKFCFDLVEYKISNFV